jgi:hypothetical protein
VIPATTSSAWVLLRAQFTTTVAPSAARRSAIVRPMPRDAAVTIATFPLSVPARMAAPSAPMSRRVPAASRPPDPGGNRAGEAPRSAP